MRSIFSKLFLSFTLTILLSGLISGLVLFSFSRRSVEWFRHDFHRQLQTNIAHSVLLMGQAAYMMQQYRGDAAFAEYIRDIQNSMRTQLYLCIGDTVMPKETDSEQRITQLAASAGKDGQPFIRDTGKELIVVQRLFPPEGRPCVVVGLHRMQPHPGWGGGPPPPEVPGWGVDGPPPPHEPSPGMPPPSGRGGFVALLRTGPEVQTVVLLLIAGIVCFKLAQSFSAPLDRLRTISRRLASGDLAARVGTTLGRPGNEIGDLARDFDHMAERMEGLVNGQKRLLLDISHELRSPLTRLNLALELAKKRLQTEDGGNLARIVKESERLNALIGQLLSLTRSEGYTAGAETLPVLLADLMLEIAEDVDFETRNLGKGIKIMDLEALEVTGSRELLRQAIENIVRNGAYYTRPDSRAEVSLFSRDSEVTGKRIAVLRIRDYGPGVPEAKLPHLTEPFFRVAEARDRNSGGTGLGLSIAYQVVRQHGGTLSFANTPDRDGLIVEIYLPLRESRPRETGPATV